MEASKVERIKEIIEESEFAYIGLRVDGCEYNPGDYAADSRVWDDGDVTEDTLNGTSTLWVRKDDNERDIETVIAELEPYEWLGGYMTVVGSFGNDGWGEDAGELIIRDAEVMIQVAIK